MPIIGILVVVAAIIAIDVPPLLKRKLRRELWVFSLLLLFGTLLSIALVLHMRIPNPMDWIIVLYQPAADLLEVWLK